MANRFQVFIRIFKRMIATQVCLGMCLFGVSPGLATPLPGNVDIQDLILTKDWLLTVDEEESKSAQIYYSDYEVAWLVSASEVGILLISPRGNSVQSVTAKSLHSKSRSAAKLDGGSTLEQVSTFTMAQHVMTFELEGKIVELKPAPPLLGRQSFTTLEDRHPQFEEKATAYRARAAAKARPPQKAAGDDLVVRVYFGSWSEICERIVPKIIAVEKEWQGVRFEYYGVPKVIPDDEVAREARITGVPTLVLLRDGEEIDRYTGRQLDDPAEVLGQALTGI